MPITTIDVTGLPTEVVQNLERLVQSLRQQFTENGAPISPRPLPHWEGTVLGPMHRREIYDDAN